MAKESRENRIPIMMSDEELGHLDDWRFKNSVSTRSETVRRLLQIGTITDESLEEIRPIMGGIFSKMMGSQEVFLDSLPEAVNGKIEWKQLTLMMLSINLKLLEEMAELKHRTDLLDARIDAFKNARTVKEAIQFSDKLSNESEVTKTAIKDLRAKLVE